MQLKLFFIAGEVGAVPSISQCSDLLYIERSDLCALNDELFVDSLISAVNATALLLQDEEDLRIIDVCTQGPSVVGLLASSIGPDCEDLFMVVCWPSMYSSLLETLSAVSTDRPLFITGVPPTLAYTTWNIIVLSDSHS